MSASLKHASHTHCHMHRTVPLGEQPRRIAHQESTRTFGVLTVGAPASAAPGSTMDTEASYLRVLDDQTFDVVASFPLAHQACPTQSLLGTVPCCTVKLPD